MKKLTITSLVLLALLISIVGKSQEIINFPKEVNSIKMTAVGVAIVSTDDALYGIDKDGKQLWKNEKFRKISEDRIEVLTGSELIIVRGGFKGGGTHVVNVFTGEKIAAEGDLYGARVAHGANQVWTNTRFHENYVWDITSNTQLYKLEINLPYGLSSTNPGPDRRIFSGEQPFLYTSDNTAILHLGLGQLGEYNLATGKAIWEFDWSPYKVKKPKGDKGDRPTKPGKGWAMMQIDNNTNTLYFPFRNMLIAVDSKTGKAKWDVKANKIDKIFNMYLTDDGIVIHTHKGINLIDKESGHVIWDKPIKIKGAGGLLINDNGTLYVVAKKSIERIDIANRKSISLTEKIKFEGGDSFMGFELIGNTIVLSGSQNLVGVDKTTGKIKYATYYKAPGASIGDIAKSAALAGVAMTATMNSYNTNSQAGNSTYRQYTANTSKYMSHGATTQAANSLYISTKFKDADAKGFGLAMVDKNTGETIKKVVIGERDPIYSVDENNGILFYKSDKTEVTIKSLK